MLFCVISWLLSHFSFTFAYVDAEESMLAAISKVICQCLPYGRNRLANRLRRSCGFAAKRKRCGDRRNAYAVGRGAWYFRRACRLHVHTFKPRLHIRVFRVVQGSRLEILVKMRRLSAVSCFFGGVRNSFGFYLDMKKFTVSAPTTLKEFTDATYPQGSFCLAALLRGKDIKVNGARVGAKRAA